MGEFDRCLLLSELKFLCFMFYERNDLECEYKRGHETKRKETKECFSCIGSMNTGFDIF